VVYFTMMMLKACAVQTMAVGFGLRGTSAIDIHKEENSIISCESLLCWSR